MYMRTCDSYFVNKVVNYVGVFLRKASTCTVLEIGVKPLDYINDCVPKMNNNLTGLE